ncbi:MAG: hypothetical protein IIA89_09405 [Chloroflexi bacterium]|nr:hypothetical protein [Chloroflexota bacterium]
MESSRWSGGIPLEAGKSIPEVVDTTATILHADGKTTVTISHAGYGTCYRTDRNKLGAGLR